MTTQELKEVANDYEMFNILLFNNSLPRKKEIDFQLHSLIFAVGYSSYREKPNKRTGNRHVIAFCRYFKFTKLQMREILVHEMIHLWQQTNVSAERYMRCSHFVAHERTFTTKMNTINIILERNGFDFQIDTVFRDKLYLEEKDAKTPFIIIFFDSGEPGYHIMWKTNKKYYDKVLEDIKQYKENFDNIPLEEKTREKWGELYRLDTTAYNFVPYGIQQRGKKYHTAKDIDTEKSLFDMFKDQCVKIEL